MPTVAIRRHQHGHVPVPPAASPVTLPAGPFRPRPAVLATRVRESVILLDRASERYLTLNEVAGATWEMLTAGLSPVAIVDRLCAEYEAPQEQVSSDVAAQLAGFLKDGLIEPGAVSHPALRAPAFAAGSEASSTGALAAMDVHLPSYLRCARLLTEVKLRLARQKYDGALEWVHQQVAGVPATSNASLEAVRAVEHRVAMAAAFYPGRALCLEQSLTLYLLLRCQGVAVRYCQGVQSHPFQAHAWVEYRGEVINDVLEHTERFTKFPDQLP